MKSPRRKRAWLAALALVFVCILFSAGVYFTRPKIGMLQNGATVQWLGITEGTNAFVDGNVIQKLLGEHIPAKGLNLGFTTLTRPRTFLGFETAGHFAWIRLSYPAESVPYDPMGRDWSGYKFFFSNGSGRELEVAQPMPYTMSSSNAVFAIRMDAYPRDESKVILRVRTQSDGKSEHQWAEFEFKNPGRTTQLPTWKIQSLPVTNVVDGLPIVLRSASASESELHLRLPSPDWSIPECQIFDQEGNRYSWSRSSGPTAPNSDCSISFPDSFGADRPWHARMKIVRARGFLKNTLDRSPQADFPPETRRRVTVQVGGPAISITNNAGKVFSCVLDNRRLTIRGSTSERPYWVGLSGSDDSGVVECVGYSWVRPNHKSPNSAQVFNLSKLVTSLTIELACPQVISTEFYFQPSE